MGTLLERASPFVPNHPHLQRSAAAADDVWAVSIQRTIAQGPFLGPELEKLAALSPQLSASIALARSLGFARAEAALDAFEASSSAVALINIDGAVFRLNRAAEALLGPDLFLQSRRLSSSSADATALLHRALHAALRAADRPTLQAPVVLPRREGRPYLAYVSRPVGIARDVFAPCQAIIVLVDLEARPRAIEEDLRQVYNFTPSESRLAVLILGGASPASAAGSLGVAYETARSLLKSALHKTDTHRQGEFVALLSRFVARIPDGRE